MFLKIINSQYTFVHVSSEFYNCFTHMFVKAQEGESLNSMPASQRRPPTQQMQNHLMSV